MNLKDYEKDKMAHPNRPLPRGLLTTKQVERAIKNILRGMIGFSFLLSLILNLIYWDLLLVTHNVSVFDV